MMSYSTQLKIFEIGEDRIIFDGRTLQIKVLPTSDPENLWTSSAFYIKPDLRSDVPITKQKTTESSSSNALIHNTQDGKRPHLWKLSINVTNTCNLACKYCYADKGVYYTGGMVMDNLTAVKSVNYVINNFTGISHVNFFGGEPTLNPKIIRLICEYFRYLLDHGSITDMPSFGLTTNCFAIHPDILELIQEYNFSITVSLDGPKEINDVLRVRKGAGGTHEFIVDNIKKIISLGIQPEFECTYTNQHHNMGIGIIDLMDFFYDNFGCEVLHIPIVTSIPGDPLSVPADVSVAQYSDAIKYSFKNYISGTPKVISTFKRLLSALATKTPIGNYCPAGRDVITINVDGKIYSCSMLMHENGFALGNISGHCASNGDGKLINGILRDGDKWSNTNCQACWAQGLCFGCLGEDIIREGGRVYRSTIPGESDSCDFKRDIAEVFLRTVCETLLSDQKETRHETEFYTR